jgi:hypothetical protein
MSLAYGQGASATTHMTRQVPTSFMTSATLPSPFVVSASSFYGGYDPYRVFDGLLTESIGWTPSTASYVSGSYSGGVTTALVGTSSYVGEWVQIKLDTAVNLTSYAVVPFLNYNTLFYRMPTTFALAGSADGTTWTLLDSQSGLTSGYLPTVPRTFNFSAPSAPMQYFRLMVNKAGLYTDGWMNFPELQLFGLLNSIQTCPSGSYCPGGISPPITCPAGYYCPANSASPTICPIGSHCGSTGLAAAITCPAGYACPSTGLTSLTLCGSQTYCPSGSQSVSFCPAGSFSLSSFFSFVIWSSLPFILLKVILFPLCFFN